MASSPPPEDVFTCCVCHDSTHAFAMVAPCGHPICGDCFLQIIMAPNEGTHRCPLCRADYPNRRMDYTGQFYPTTVPTLSPDHWRASFHLACAYGRVADIAPWLPYAPDINVADPRLGETGLIGAATNGNYPVVHLLLHHGAAINRGNRLDKAALYGSASNGHTAVVHLLLANGAEVDQGDNLGDTALLIAAHQGHTDTVTALLTHGATIHQHDVYGQTALMLSAQQGHMDTAWLLLLHGANINQTDRYGTTAISYSRRGGHEELYLLLLSNLQINGGTL